MARKLHWFINKYGEGKFWDFHDAVQKGFSDEWIADNVLHVARQHVGRYRRHFFRTVTVLHEHIEAELYRIVETRKGLEDATETRLREHSIIRVGLDATKHLRKVEGDTK